MSEQRLSLALSEIERAIAALYAQAERDDADAQANRALAERLESLVDIARRSGS